MDLLKTEEINARIKNLNGWNYSNNALQKEYSKNDFADAISFIVKTGIEAEKMDHHPDLFLHSWNKVDVTLSTHSAGGVTENDFKLAEIIEKIK
jgi:4a-hydroxytetrahydrobiopterin dehydratase